jgi:hypothetical protein
MTGSFTPKERWQFQNLIVALPSYFPAIRVTTRVKLAQPTPEITIVKSSR